MDREQFYQGWREIVEATDFKCFLETVDKSSLSDYAEVDWRQATVQTFLKMYWPRGSEMGAIQSDEALLMTKLCLAENPEYIVEIGTMAGVSTRLLGALAKRNNGKVVSIDAGMNPGVKPNLEMLKLDSTVTLIKEWVPWLTYKPEKEIDLLFIDGDHTLISIIVDYHYFNYYLKKGGIVVFHDMNLKASQEAVELIRRRDPLVEIASAGRMSAFRKVSEPGERYFETIPERKG